MSCYETIKERDAEIERLRKWIYATAVSFNRSGLTLEEYNEITKEVKASFAVNQQLTMRGSK